MIVINNKNQEVSFCDMFLLHQRFGRVIEETGI